MEYKKGILIIGIIILVQLMFTNTYAFSVGDYSNRATIKTKTSLVTGTHTDFPVLITENNLPSNIWSITQTDGDDIVFSIDGSTQLNHELVFYDTSTNTTEIWVKLPYLNSTTATEFKVYYGNSTVTSTSTNATWNYNYVFVNHMNGITDVQVDSSNANQTYSSTTGTPSNTTGQIGKAIYFNAGDKIEFNDASSLDLTGSNYCSLAWVQVSFTDTNNGKPVLTKASASATTNYQHWIGDDISGTNRYVYSWNSTTNINSTSQLNNWTWAFTGLTQVNTTYKQFFLNGISNGYGLQTLGAVNSGKLIIADSPYVADNYRGTIDEIRLLNTTCSEAFVNTTYQSTYNSTNFLTTKETWIITAVELTNNATINSFNVTINGTEYNTTTGSIDTLLEKNGSYYELTFTNNNFETSTQYTTSSTNYQAGLNQKNITFNPNVTYTSLKTQQPFTINCNPTNPTNLNYNITYYINNVNDSYLTTQYENQTYYTNLTDFYDHLDFYCIANTTYKNQTSNNVTLNEKTLNTDLIFNITGNSITLPSVTINYTNISLYKTSNPVTISANNFLNQTTHYWNELIIVNDTNNYHVGKYTYVNITETTTTYEITLDPNKLYIEFEYNGTSNNTNGWISDTNATYGFTNSTVVIIQSNLQDGYVHVRFGCQTDGTNCTQYYDYINNKSIINETLELLDTTDWTGYVKVVDYAGSPLKDVVIRIESANNILNTWTQLKTIGQRITDEEGYVYFQVDSTQEVLLTITKQNYEPIEVLITIGDTEFTKTNPLIIYLKQTSVTIQGNYWINIAKQITNKTSSITGVITAKGTHTVEIQTSYRNQTTADYEELTGNNLGKYTFTLDPNEHFDSTTTDDITLYIKIDGEEQNPITIKLNQTTPVEPFKFGFDIHPLLISILIIGVPMIISIKYSTSEWNIKAFYFLGAISVILNQNFIWLSLICIFTPLAKGIIGGILNG